MLKLLAVLLTVFHAVRGGSFSDPCRSNPCGDQGTCHSSGHWYKCECPENYINDGNACVYDPCYGNPCGNYGTCDHDGTNHWCRCAAGYKGEPCVPNEFYAFGGK